MGSEGVVVVGHGSHTDAGADVPVLRHAETVRETGEFDEVREAFWKEEPYVSEVLRTLESTTVYVVPLFMSHGYFVDEVIPRELGDEGDVRYTPPVGTHPSMTDVIVERVEESGGAEGVALVGHGTERNERSGEAVEYHVERLRDEGFEQVEGVFIDQEPYVGNVTDVFGTDDVAVVPFFVAEGGHTRDDIPRELGIPRDSDVSTVDGCKIRYTEPVGTHEKVADVVVERVSGVRDGTVEESVSGHVRGFVDWLEDAEAPTWGELSIRRTRDGYEVRHVDDAGTPDGELEELDRHELRYVAKFDSDGVYRPLKSAPTLDDGWRVARLEPREVAEAVDFVYPASVANRYREREGELDVTPWEETAERQTGIYSDVGDVSGDELADVVESFCSDCLKRRVWGFDGDGGEGDDGDDELVCREACSYLVEGVREKREKTEEVVT